MGFKSLSGLRTLTFRVSEVFPGAVHIQAVSLRRRTNTADFPESGAKGLSGPLHCAHIDYTREGAQTLFEDVYKRREDLRTKEFQLINVWRVLDDPCNTRPLGFCDYTTTSLANDLEYCDFVDIDKVMESWRAYHNPQHKWLYLGDQRKDEVFVFRIASSKGLSLPCPIHSALTLPLDENAGHRDVVGLSFGVFF